MNEAKSINIYKLLGAWYSFKLDNGLSGNHTDLFFYLVDLNNSLAWKENFGVGINHASEGLNMSPNTVRKCLSDLVRLEIVKMIKKSKNQFTANQISMAKAYQILLKLKQSDYKAIVKAQVRQLRGSCTIDIHRDNTTPLHENNVEESEKKSREIEELKKEIQKLKSEHAHPLPKKSETKKTTKVQKSIAFYELQINSLNGQTESPRGQTYLKFISWLKGELKNENTSSCEGPKKALLGIENQLNFEDYCKLVKKANELNVYLPELFEQMENRPDLMRRYSNLYRSSLNWIKKS